MTKSVSDRELAEVSGGIDLSRADDPSAQMPEEEVKIAPPGPEPPASGVGGGGGGGSTTTTHFNQNPPSGLGD